LGDVLFWRGLAAESIRHVCLLLRLVNWTKWTGSDLVEPGESYDKTYAHKPWVLKYNGVVYHFYCAVSNEGRVIALATSHELKIDGPH
jgi:predicted GH43/DUF377 family glycosyl hydrolase